MKIDGKSSIETDDNNKHWMCQSTVLGARSTSLCKLHLKQNVLSLTYVPAGAGVCNLYKGLLIASLLHLAQHSRGSYHTFSYCLRPGKWNKHLCEKKKIVSAGDLQMGERIKIKIGSPNLTCMSLLILCGSRANSWPFYGINRNRFQRQ